MAKITHAISKCLTLVIRVYQYCISPFLGNCCRFYPSCSEYTIEAIHVHGCCYGLFFSVRRLVCCHPWHQGGFDPIPEKK